MAVQRSTYIDASPDDAYDAARELLGSHVDDGAFVVWDDEPGERWGITWSGMLASSRYLFEFRPEGEGTAVDAQLWLSGPLGPLHSLLRRRGNRAHVDGILAGMKGLAESEEFVEDEAEDEEIAGAPAGTEGDD